MPPKIEKAMMPDVPSVAVGCCCSFCMNVALLEYDFKNSLRERRAMPIFRSVARAATIVIESGEVAWCRQVALNRRTQSRRAHVVDRLYSSAGGVVTEEQGVMGEFALCRLLGVDPFDQIDATGTPQSARTDRFDIRVPRRWWYGCTSANFHDKSSVTTIDVKCVRNGFSCPILVTEAKLTNQADHYCLMTICDCPTQETLPPIGEPIRVAFVGAITGANLFVPKNFYLKPSKIPGDAPQRLYRGFNSELDKSLTVVTDVVSPVVAASEPNQ